MSAIETATNIAIGYTVAVFAQIFIFPFYGIHLPVSQNLEIGLFFTAVSIIRGYALRRLFNKIP
jgi:hypothetical protein